MNILFTVCGRAGSKGVKGKNFKAFLGIPLIYYTFAAIELYREMHPEIGVVVALNTDSTEMIELAKKAIPGILFIERKEELAGDYVAKIDVIADTLREVLRQTNISFEMVVDCDITSPLRTAGDIEALIEKKARDDNDIVFSVTNSRRNPYFNMVKELNDGTVEVVIKSGYTARQQAPTIYDMNASLYAYKLDFLISGKKFSDATCGMIFMQDTAVLDIDNEGDFELMQVIATFLFEHNIGMRAVSDKAKKFFDMNCV